MKTESILLRDRLNVTESSTENINHIVIMSKPGDPQKGPSSSPLQSTKGFIPRMYGIDVMAFSKKLSSSQIHSDPV